MSQTNPLKLPDSVYRRLVKAAKESGTTPAKIGQPKSVGEEQREFLFPLLMQGYIA